MNSRILCNFQQISNFAPRFLIGKGTLFHNKETNAASDPLNPAISSLEQKTRQLCLLSDSDNYNDEKIVQNQHATGKKKKESYIFRPLIHK